MDKTRQMEILVIGAGAIGTYVGGSLALRGHRVVFVERPEIAAELREHGLRLQHSTPSPQRFPFTGVQPALSLLKGSTFHVAASLEEALTPPISTSPFKVAIFALKSYDTPSAIQSFLAAQQLQLAMPPVLCLSNGVDNEPALAEALGPDQIIAGTVTTAIGRRAVGDIVVERLRGIGIAGGQPLSEDLLAAFNNAGLNARLYLKANDMKWSKMLTNLMANATSAILDMTPAEIFAHPGLYRLEVEQLREALRVMAARGIGIVNLPHTPVRLLALGIRLPPMLSRPLLIRAVGSGRGGKMPSFHIDLHSGRGQSEVDFLNGSVVRYGQQAGIPTPVNHLLNQTLLALTRRELPIDAFTRQPEKLLAGLAKPG